jgi:hypothetical protein
MEKFSRRKLNGMEVKEEYQVKISIGLEDLDDNVDINRACKIIKANT